MGFDQTPPRAYISATHAAFGLPQGETGYVDDSPEVVRAAQLGLIEILAAPDDEPVTFNGAPIDDSTLDTLGADTSPATKSFVGRSERRQSARSRRTRRMPLQADSGQ